MMKRMRWLTIAPFGLLASFFLGCNLPQDQGIKLGVPFRSQVNFNYCAAASVLMWRLYDDPNAEISQESIFTWMSNSYPACGSNQLGVEAAVRHFTFSGSDAYWDNVAETEYEGVLSRQISSIDSRVPVIAVVDFDHTGVVNGGKWHAEGNYNVWDFVYFHDPGSFANRQISATDWMHEFCPGYWGGCDQIISGAASSAWFFNLKTYSDRVVAAGGGIDPREDWPPAY
jgi:Papain-like cysteine protease AvrRpt2